MRHAVAAEVIKFLETKIFHQHGVPEFIHSDNGKQFVSQIFGELMIRYGMRLDFTPRKRSNNCQIRQKVTQRLNRTHEPAEKAYNIYKLVEFSVGQVVYRKNYRQGNKADGYIASLSYVMPMPMPCY